jgi:two-component system, OmpR family, sensor histidine kinase MtrB
MKSSHTSLQAWLQVTVGLVFLFTVALASFMAVTTNALNRAVHDTERDLEGSRVASELQAELLNQVRISSLVNVLGSDAYAQLRTDSETRLRSLLRESRLYIGTPAERELVDRITAKLDPYLADLERLEAADTRYEEILRRLQPRVDEIIGSVHALEMLNAQQAAVTARDAARTNRAANVASAAALAWSIIAGSGTLLLAYRYLNRPLQGLTETIRRYRSGEKGARAAVTGPKEIREIGEAFNELSHSLQRQKELQMAALAGVAHDLKNSLVGFHLLLPTLSRPEVRTPAETSRTLGLLERQLAQAKRMTADLLQTVQAEAGQLELHMLDADLVQIAAGAVSMAGTAFPSHTIELAHPDAAVPVKVDPVRIQQVLDNLLQNAIKYSPSGSHVQVVVRDEEGQARLSVSDHGTGIHEEEMQALFTPFYRTSSARQGMPGSGLGLSIAQRIVEAHGGRIRVQSRPGQGSTFTVSLPRAQQARLAAG